MKDGAAGGVWRTARAGSWNQEGGREREDRGRQRADGGVQSPEQGSREIETSKPRNLETSKPRNLKTSKPKSRKAEKPKSRKAEKPKSRKAEKPKSPAPPRHQRIETESAGRAARAGGSPDKHAARSRRVLGPPRPDAVFARGASAAAHAALW
ncbi:hypothetical protein [Burkholderia mallei]|uniref:hypothetical protein n=1 Tax=Burkholderia mallei TaxID=13373 RepID=UPI0005D85014|nr:hypothetical protein [Burkholderia mallei]AJX50844.1 hypothetical protein BM47_3477 [Burkholderia mallei]